jgi:Tfp pilus assembly protein PilO
VTARFTSLNAKTQVAVVAGGLLLVVIIGYFAVISPKRSDAAHLKQQTAAVQKQIDANRSTGFMQALPAVRSASVFSLAKAMPKQLETPNVIIELSGLAFGSGISFDQISPGTSSTSPTTGVPTSTTASTDPFAVEPIQVQFSGSFYNLVSFLQRLRNLVRVENGRLNASGRLFDVSDIAFCEVPATSCSSTTATPGLATSGGPVESTFPHVQAVLTINAFVPQQPVEAAPTGTDTTSTSTTTTGTTTTTPAPTSAAPSTSGGTS